MNRPPSELATTFQHFASSTALPHSSTYIERATSVEWIYYHHQFIQFCCDMRLVQQEPSRYIEIKSEIFIRGTKVTSNQLVLFVVYTHYIY